ncbi:GNAT family N-acetyltransferase [Pantoea sp. Al-1710]|uniref:GNAT family N-acetyltransferase n=2 Tax=Candidatus Pantoea communis TaxID=2608354 RepID=A0ABX0RWD6_9GAMM|nr:GNAT family N-acetyltransferase [Pantoea communis]
MDMMLRFMLSQYAGLPFSQNKLHSWLEKWIYEQERKCADSAFAARFPWKETGLHQSYFLQRKLCINGRYFLTGPRYKGGDINCPFIDVVASSAGMDDSVLKAISREWRELKPQHIRQLTPGHIAARGITDQLIYASFPANKSKYYDDALTLKPAAGADFDWCRQALLEAYQHSWSTIPALSGSLRSVDHEDLSKHILKGHAYIIYEQGDRAGLIICEPGEIAFLKGCRISEEVILPTFRGRALASRAQRLLRNSLYHFSQEDCLITGTILPENFPSIRTAEKAGRTCVLRYEFLPVIFD